MLGLGYFADKQFDNAIPALKKCIELSQAGPRDAGPFDTLGLIYSEKKQYDQAIHFEKKAVDLEPRNSLFLNNLANDYFWSGQIQAALEAYERAAQMDPCNATIRNNLQRAKQRWQEESPPLQQQRAAEMGREGRFQQVFKLNPDDILTVGQVNEVIITWKNQHLNDLIQKSSASDLRECADLIEHTILQATAASEREKDEAQRLESGGISGGNEHTELAVAYRLRIEVLKPILAVIKEEIANRGK
jgi:tetratricopeptide (TPR) repeat protein